MPTYSFYCPHCNHSYELYMLMCDYTDNQQCPECGQKTQRDYQTDLSTTTSSVIKSDNEIKLGHLAERNSSRMSDDEKRALAYKHNEYLFKTPERDLPSGIKRRKRDPEKFCERIVKGKDRIKPKRKINVKK